MSKKQQLQSGNYIQFHPIIASKLGTNRSIILSQINFLLQCKGGVDYNEQHWIYETALEFHNYFFPWIKPKTIAQYLIEMQRLGILESITLDVGKLKRRKCYRINREKLQALISSDTPIRKSTLKKAEISSEIAEVSSAISEHTDARKVKNPLVLQAISQKVERPRNITEIYSDKYASHLQGNPVNWDNVLDQINQEQSNSDSSADSYVQDMYKTKAGVKCSDPDAPFSETPDMPPEQETLFKEPAVKKKAAKPKAGSTLLVQAYKNAVEELGLITQMGEARGAFVELASLIPPTSPEEIDAVVKDTFSDWPKDKKYPIRFSQLPSYIRSYRARQRRKHGDANEEWIYSVHKGRKIRYKESQIKYGGVTDEYDSLTPLEGTYEYVD